MSLLLALTAATETVPHAAQPKARRSRLKWREYENLPPDALEALTEAVNEEQAGPNSLADSTELQIAQESQRLAALLSAAKIEQENARQRAKAAEIAQEISAVRVAMAEMVEAARLAERLAQEIEELDVAYITATLLND